MLSKSFENVCGHPEGLSYDVDHSCTAHIASRPGEITHILAERTVLQKVNNPFIVGLKFSFQNTDRLYLAMPLSEPYFLFGSKHSLNVAAN